MKKKSTRQKVSEHTGIAWEEMEEYRYQPACYNKPVYTVGDEYFSAGHYKPSYKYGDDGIKWKRVKNNYDGTMLWAGKSVDNTQ